MSALRKVVEPSLVGTISFEGDGQLMQVVSTGGGGLFLAKAEAMENCTIADRIRQALIFQCM